MDFRTTLSVYDLCEENAVVIGSGILGARGIRESNDIDVVVSKDAFQRLTADARLTAGMNHGRPVLRGDDIEIFDIWEVLGRVWRYEDLTRESVIIDCVRFITPEFLLRVKESWSSMPDARQKDIDDVQLIRKYLAEPDRLP